jgi:hypothetical protein
MELFKKKDAIDFESIVDKINSEFDRSLFTVVTVNNEIIISSTHHDGPISKFKVFLKKLENSISFIGYNGCSKIEVPFLNRGVLKGK